MGGGAIPVPPSTLPDPIFSIFKAERPTHGQMKAILEVSHEVSQIGSRIDQELTRIDPESTLPRPLPDWSRDDPPDPISQTSDI